MSKLNKHLVNYSINIRKIEIINFLTYEENSNNAQNKKINRNRQEEQQQQQKLQRHNER